MAALVAAAGTYVAGAAGASSLIASTVITGLSILSKVAAGRQAYMMGEAQQKQAELQAEAAEINSRMEAITINEELLKILSKNTVAAAASGILSSGSVARAQEAAQHQAARELDITRFNAATTSAAYRAKGAMDSASGAAAATGSLFEAVELGYSSYKKIQGT